MNGAIWPDDAMFGSIRSREWKGNWKPWKWHNIRPSNWGNDTPIDEAYIRYADVLLMYAVKNAKAFILCQVIKFNFNWGVALCTVVVLASRRLGCHYRNQLACVVTVLAVLEETLIGMPITASLGRVKLGSSDTSGYLLAQNQVINRFLIK